MKKYIFIDLITKTNKLFKNKKNSFLPKLNNKTKKIMNIKISNIK